MVLRGLSIWSQKISKISAPFTLQKGLFRDIQRLSQINKKLKCRLKTSHDLEAVGLQPVIQPDKSH